MLKKQVITRKLAEYDQVKQLYFTVFPKAERVPFCWLMLQARKQFIEYIAFYDDTKFVGFAYIISYQKMTYIFYLAVDPKLQGHGYGSQILQDIFKMYSGQNFCLSVERPDKKAANAEQREKRIQFYQRNGFVLSDKVAVEQGVEYAMLYHGHDFEKSTYIHLIEYFAGIFKKIFKTEFIK